MGLPGDKNWKEAANHAASFQLSHEDVHIWSASLEQPAEYREKLFLLLSFDERIRVGRFYFEKDRNRYIIGRGLLRCILGGYLRMEPSQIEFVYGQYGKPSLKSEMHDKVLGFNLSHSQDLALYAIGWNCKIGIDIEYVHPMPDMDKFAEQFFSPRESALINSFSAKQKEEVFFKIWTCKEAFLKANGSGLRIPLNQVEISLGTKGSAILRSIGSDRQQAVRWHLETFIPAPGYQASLAIEGNDRKIVFKQLNNCFSI